MENGVEIENNLSNMTGDEVVISGISGEFPKSESVLELMDNLYNKVDMVSEIQWPNKDLELPRHAGKIKNIGKFDAQFFKVGYQQARILEPISKKLLEHTYGAIFDSGNTHATLNGKKIGVFIGSSFSDFSTLKFYLKQNSDFVVGGSSKAMQANRISYWIDGKGPSYTMDYSCVSSAAALDRAFNSIKSGECDAAVVGSGNLCTHPMLCLNLKKAGLLCMDGKTKCFNKNADGYVRAEAINILFLQRAKDAKRIYTEVYHTKGSYKLKPDALFLPLQKSQELQKFFSNFYSETDIYPKDIEYVEANGAALAEADENELEVIANIFANNKTVKVGCVKSNMGHSEPVSGITAITKLCLAYHKGEIPANIHYNEPHDQIEAVRNGSVQVLTEHAKFDRGYTAVNNFSYSGAAYHFVLKGHYKPKNLDKYKCSTPRLIPASGRDETCVQKIFDALKSKPVDAEEIALLHDIFSKDMVGHTGRGYTILGTNEEGETVNLGESIDYYPGVKRPLWFVYSGMGSQWQAMGADLMRIPTFAKAIERCHKVLEPKGIDLVKVLTEPDKTIFDNILNAFVGIGAVQIGLTDILKEMGVEPDYIIGHSLGEMACAYHDNTLIAEELMLSTYSRGKAVQESRLVRGAMAAVGLGYKDLVNQCPPDIDIACHNSSESTTISGPEKSMKEFVGELTRRGIFARTVPSANVAYHSRYVADAGRVLLTFLSKVIKEPKLRSHKWISTSVPREEWDKPDAKYSSAKYHTNNLLKPVLFEEMTAMIPPNAVVVEIAPHGLLQAILKRSHKNCLHIPLTRRGCTDGVKFFLDAIGKLYQAGYNPKVNVLYPKVEFPVSTETPLLSHLVKWEHSEDWPVLGSLEDADKVVSSSRDLLISTHDDEYRFITGYAINGVIKLPESALLVYVWETLAMHRGVNYKELPVVFKDIVFHSEVTIKPETPVQITVIISKGNDKFEVSQEDILIVSGIVSLVRVLKFQNIEQLDLDFDDVCLNSGNIYKILNMRGFSFHEQFQSIHSISLKNNKAYIKCTDNWVTFLDSLIQYNAITRSYSGISKPKFIRKLKISNFIRQTSKVCNVDGVDVYPAQIDSCVGITRCAGVEIDKITFIDKIEVDQEPNLLKERSFFPFYPTEKIDIKIAVEVNLQIIAENSISNDINITILASSTTSDVLASIKNVAQHVPSKDINIKNVIIGNTDLKTAINTILDTRNNNGNNVVVLENVLEDSKKIISLQNTLTYDDFVLTLEKQIPKMQMLIKEYFTIITCMSNGEQILLLLKRKDKQARTSYIPVTIDNEFSWLPRVQNELVTTNRVVLVSDKQPFYGTLGFVNKLRRNGFKNISTVIIQDFHGQKFDPKNEFYEDQLNKNLAVNILRKNQWGGYYYTSCANSIKLKSITLKNTVPGSIFNLSWSENPPLTATKNLVQVCYSGLSLKDCQIAVNNFKTDDQSFGMDFSGMDKNGDKVMGLISGGAVSSAVVADSDLLWPVPDIWTLEEAATISLPYAHAFYCLTIQGQIRKGQRVLIIDGADALGQALISLCTAMNCTIFTTVNDMDKKKTLLKMFPELNEDNICYSHQDIMYNMVMINTKKQGCHLVINSAISGLRETALRCVGFLGRFLDLCQHEMQENKELGMRYFELDRTYKSVNLSYIFRPENSNDRKFIQKCVSEGISRGIVKPLTRIVYSPTRISKAFRLLSINKHTGRVLIRIRDPVVMNQGLNVLPRISFAPQDVLVIVCDKTGLGFELADRFIDRGLRKIVLHMKSSQITGYEHYKIISWSKQEVSVKLSTENLHTEQGCTTLLRNARKFGKVKGVFIVQDSAMSDIDEKKEFVEAYENKFTVVSNLDVACRNGVELSYFVVISHLTKTVSDEYSLSLTERVCELRNEIGLPALIMRFNSFVEFEEPMQYSKFQPQLFSSFFNSLEASMKLKYKNVLTLRKSKTNNDIEYINKLAEILGVNDIHEISDEILLKDLYSNEIILKEIRALIKITYDVDLPIDKILHMNVKSLKEINKNGRDATDFDSDMAVFCNKVDNESDYICTHPIVYLPTLVNSVDEDPAEANYITMIPGFEGRVDMLKPASERLKLPAVGVQLGPDMEGDSFLEMAASVRKLMKTKFIVKSKFYILGYSFGVNVALELAAILENEGHIGVVYCVDSSPEALKIHLDAYLPTSSDAELQNSVLHHMTNLINGKTNEDLKENFGKCHSFDEKVANCLRKLKEVESFSVQYKKKILESAYKRIKLALNYESNLKLKSEVILMKGIAHPNANLLTYDYGLSKYTVKPIKVFNLASNHSSALADCRVSSIVNAFLDDETLEGFKKKNLCKTYFVEESNNKFY